MASRFLYAVLAACLGASACASSPTAPPTTVATSPAELEFRLVVDDNVGSAFPKDTGGTVHLDPNVIVTSADVAKAEYKEDSTALAPSVQVTLVPRAASRFEDFTRAHVGQELAVVIEGKVTSSPVIKTAIQGGKMSLTFHSGDDAKRVAGELSKIRL